MLGLVLVENKTNEIKAIRALLELLELRCIITIDAMGTQEIARRCGQRRRLRFVSQSKPSQLMRTGESCEFGYYVRYYSRNSVRFSTCQLAGNRQQNE